MSYKIDRGFTELRIGELDLALDAGALRELAKLSAAAVDELDGEMAHPGFATAGERP